MGRQLVYTPDGDVLDKHLHVLCRAPGVFDWVLEADEVRIDQLAITLQADFVRSIQEPEILIWIEW
jgi:hypothetical protein